ncbi:MAG: glycine--tRNA ligase [Nanoarchaeota archaeon]|nr:glycine--tRNA ligase [Nanoarchaeota archaeon]
MAFVVKQKVYGKDYYYLRKSVREGNKVRSKMIAYLGKDKKEAEKKAKDIIAEMEKIKRKEVKQDDMGNKEDKKSEREHKKISIDELANFCKRKGFVFRSSDIYGGFAGFWDFGPLGVELFNNIKNNWWNHFVQQKENMVGIDASIISHPKTWKASGHIANFNVNDYLVPCKKCKKSGKVDKPDLKKIKCVCGGEYDWENAKVVEQMFKTNVGLDKQDSYLRGETAQGMFMDFKLVQQTSRMQLPFGIAQIGKCFRNEIAPRDFLFRCREFHIGEFEFFLRPVDEKCDLLTKEHLNLKLRLLDAETQKKGSEELKLTTIKEMFKEKRFEEWHAYWLAEQIMWFKSLGLDEIKIREHTKDELSHYSSATFDIDYEYPFGSKEVAGNANRGQYDLTQHQNESKQSMEIFDEKSGKNVLPKVIEPTFGMERVFLAILTKAYYYDKKRDYVVLRIPKKIAPIKAAIFPIVKKPEFEKISQDVYDLLKDEWNVVYDKSGSIGRRYARNDEIGTPYCITVDGDSLKNKDVTVRIRDTCEQVRIKIDNLKDALREAINGKDIKNFGKLVDTRKK